MSRDLPDRPHLDHLKKQAKALLRELRRSGPDATLADALHALARDYGFASWPKLKAHVEAPGSTAQAPPLFARFTEAARRTLFFSRYEATQLGQFVIDPEHVLLGVLRGAAGVTRGVLANAGVTLDGARAMVEASSPPPQEVVEPLQVPFQTQTRALFSAAADEADRLGHQKIGTVHVVLALLRNADTAAAYLQERGMTLDSVRVAASLDATAAQDDEANT